MASPVLVAVAVAVPVLAIGVGGGYWYYKADRVVASGDHRGWEWRVNRVAMQYTAEVRAPATTDNPAPAWGTVLGEIGSGNTSPWLTADTAQAQAITFVDQWLGTTTVQSTPLRTLEIVSV